ncbi:pentatricopeptide repeat-containing protein At1g32415, mitochondrial [Magnolia sinica]|uniref:pentatricopeptide repeat-containing protein At1g32415, mitochondrial n=1 Tax=Magnolia sinica TaxID=86752 RepID=UPI00265A4EA7|nr:pentatricopeptide repeat-containing protein At1g32415, mitochondrial [Magnolia sinica]
MPSPCFRQLDSFLSPRFKHCICFFHVRSFKTQLSISTVHYRKSASDNDSELLCCLSQRKLREARLVLDKMPQRGGSNVVCWTSMLSRYARDGFVDEARMLFEIMPVRNIVTWNAMLSAYVQFGRLIDARQLFEEMPERNVVSWTSMLCGFARAGMLDDAKRLFDVMPNRNVVSWNSMISGLIQNCDLEEARRLFDRMPVRNQVSWNAMIAGYAENLRMEEARRLFDVMPDANVVTWTSLIAGYCRIGDIEEAYDLFVKMPVRNVVSWTAMIGGLAWNGFFEKALLVFLEMKGIGNVKPNVETFISLFYACAGLGFPYLGKQLHAHLILNGLDHDDYDGRLLKSLIHMYSRFGIMDTASCLFTSNSDNHIIESLNSMINGYICFGQLENARHLFNTVPFRDMISWTSMISGYFHAGDVTEACWLFGRMPVRDAISWTAMISGHVQNELFDEAMYLFSEMRVVGIGPLDSTFSTLLGAAGAMAYLDLGKQFHSLLLKTRLKFDIILDNSLISMYAKCGEIYDACRIFDKMTSRDVISWNSMIIGLSHHGLAKKALELFESMRGVGMKPNAVTFLGILSACSHTGMIDQGWEFFNSMMRDHSIPPADEHYISIIDLLGRAGKIAEAEEFVCGLPFEPGPTIWGALLGVCSLGNVNADVGKRAALRILELEPLNAPAHVLLCNIYAATNQQREEGMLRKAMGAKGVRKVPGCSWIQLKGRVHVFLSGDRSHPQTDEILSLLAGDSRRS